MIAWTSTARAGAILTITLVVVVTASLVVALGGAPVAGGVTLLVVGGTVFVFARVVVVVDERGLTVRSGTVPLVRVHFPLERIESVEAIDVNPWRWGGWGYRGSVRVFRRAAWVIRRGSGIKVNLARGRVFVVTVDDAEAGALALQRRLE